MTLEVTKKTSVKVKQAKILFLKDTSINKLLLTNFSRKLSSRLQVGTSA